MNKYRYTPIQILTEAKNPLHYKETTKQALDKGILETDGGTPDSSMNAPLLVKGLNIMIK